jgi:uncharacterized protein
VGEVAAPSRYNFAVPFRDQTLLFNAFSGALVSLEGRDGAVLGAMLTSPRIDLEVLPVDLAGDLLEKGFLTLDELGQFEAVRERFREARRSTPMVLTVTTTLDCNLGCYYCYEERTADRLRTSDIEVLVAQTRTKLMESGRSRLHVDWYGGEPLQNLEFMEAASRALQSLCRDLGVTYRSSVISNGTLWPEDVGAFVQRHAISQVQISFDGVGSRHDKIRRFRSSADRQAGLSSYALAVNLVDHLADHVRVDARFNIDRTNAQELHDFVGEARRRGWFKKPFPVVIQPARVSDYSERSGFLKGRKLSLEEFDSIRAELRGTASSAFRIEESEVPDGYPYPKTTVCAALVDDSSVFGADGHVYRCGLQVSERHRAVGSFRAESDAKQRARFIPIRSELMDAAEQQAQWWKQFDPCEQPTCSVCSFLPICMGGCPKKHLEGDRASLDEQGAYWRRNLARLLAHAAESGSTSDFEIPRSQQFRTAASGASE